MTKMTAREQVPNNKKIVIGTTRNSGFDKKKNELKTFSKNLPRETELPSVPISGGLFGWFDYDVKGSDLNRLTEIIQDRMIEQNKVLVRTIQEFNTIYDTFNALDKEYIQGILVSLKVAEEANAKALKGLEGVLANQNEIKQIINQQKQVIQVLEKFKDNIDNIEHLGKVDEMFITFSAMQDNVKGIETKVGAQELKLADITNVMKELLSKQSNFQGNLDHIKENQDKQFKNIISTIGTISKESKTHIETLNEKVNIYGEKLGDLKQLFQDDMQNLSEKVVRYNSEFEVKIDSITNEVRKIETNFDNAIKELDVGIKQKTDMMNVYFEAELTRAKSEITELSIVTGILSKRLKTTKVIIFANFVVIFILVILLISGVL